VDLEKRVCKCGCGAEFKVLASSPLEYASRKCAFRDSSKTEKKAYRPNQEDIATLKKLNSIFNS
jgi:hypothetical protein